MARHANRHAKRIRISRLMREEWGHLTRFNESDRHWQMPVAAALAAGLPLLIAAWTGHLAYGLIGSIGGMVFLYLPPTPLHHRMVTLMACGFGMIACYALGLLSHFLPIATAPLIGLVTMLVTMVIRYYRIGPPGAMFFVMPASIAAFQPTGLLDAPMQVGLFTLGALLAGLIAFVYSLINLRVRAPKPVELLPEATFDFVIYDSVIIGLVVGLSLALAQAFEMPRAYWAPLSCLAVIQGVSLRAVWNRQIQRIAGTGVGLGLAWGIFALPLSGWLVALLVIALSFVIETMIVRHYGFGVVFITPLTILLADAATLGSGPPTEIIGARFWDTVLGCLVGLAGALFLHNARLRDALGRQLRRLAPARFEKSPAGAAKH